MKIYEKGHQNQASKKNKNRSGNKRKEDFESGGINDEFALTESIPSKKRRKLNSNKKTKNSNGNNNKLLIITIAT